MVKRATIGILSLAALVGTTLFHGSRAEARAIRVITTRISVTVKGRKPSKKAVKSAISRQVAGLKTCFKGALKGKRKYTGWLWLTFKFRRSGTVYAPTISSTVGDNITKMCVKMNMKRWTVGKGGGGNATVTAKIKK